MPQSSELQTAESSSSNFRGLDLHIEPGVFDKLASQITLSGGPRKPITAPSPYTGQVLGRIPAGLEADVELAVHRARAAQPAWAARSFVERAKIFLRFYDLLVERHAEGLDLIQLETGKARSHAFEEILDCCGPAAGRAHCRC